MGGWLVEHIQIERDLEFLMHNNHNIDMEIRKRTWTMLGVWKGESDANLMLYYARDDYDLQTTTHEGLTEPIAKYYF